MIAASLVLSACSDDDDAQAELSWQQLRNTDYPSSLQPGKTLTLTDGIATEPTSDGGTRTVARLVDIGAFGEIDRGDAIDSVVFLAEVTDAGSLVTSVAAVLNEDGEPSVSQPVLLGENVVVVGAAIEDGEITTRVRALGSYSSAESTIDEITRTSTLDGDALEIEDESTEKVSMTPPADFTYEPTTLDPGSEDSVQFTIEPRRAASFVVAASAGQEISVETTSEFDSAILSIQGLSDDTTVVPLSSYSTLYSGPVTATQSYSVRVWSVAGEELEGQLDVRVTGEAEAPPPEPEPTTPSLPENPVPKSDVRVPGPEESLGELSRAALEYVGTRAPARGVAVITADDGALFVENGDEQLETASVIKVVVMVCTMHRAEQQGRLVDEWELSLMWPMITYSDNDATDVLWYDLGGGPGIAACLQEIEAPGITPYMGDYWGTSTASARGIATLMGRIAFGSVVNDAHRTAAIAMLVSVIAEQRWGIPAGADESGAEIVGVKDGWYPDDDGWRVNSVGFISPIAGGSQPYAIALMTNNQTTQEYGIATIEGVAMPVYDELRP